MRLHQVLPVLAALLGASLAEAKSVFAHYMVGNVASFSQADWAKDIQLAQDSEGVRGGRGAELQALLLLRLRGRGPWDKGVVTNYIKQYKTSPAYFLRDGRPLVSTFEGTGNTGDWPGIKSDTNAFFMPDYSSLGAQGAAAAPGVDGLFSWDAWPVGASDKSSQVDKDYVSQLGGKPYMMPVSPWFFTNLPNYNKNRLWRGDDLWYDRWQQVLDVNPDYVEIITWNDYGESHYIGPLYPALYGVFGPNAGNAPYNYVEDMPHDGWRAFLPYIIQKYKMGSAPADKEGLVTWYRTQPARACDTGGTAGNADYEPTVAPYDVVQDKIFFSALLNSAADVTVSVNGVNLPGASWRNTPAGGSGIYHGSVAYNGNRGAVVVTVSRSGGRVAQVQGASITDDCKGRAENWNAWVGSAGSGALRLLTRLPPPRRRHRLPQPLLPTGTPASRVRGMATSAAFARSLATTTTAPPTCAAAHSAAAPSARRPRRARRATRTSTCPGAAATSASARSPGTTDTQITRRRAGRIPRVLRAAKRGLGPADAYGRARRT
ncbi:carbohydrate-binding module family 24 protein [Apiospora phragmitis]|uniref:Carbohydrate-binding module family 24 protein n=1 Tax=Apiospora phragmitis TaxID=2905665 RepID=A0ABR1VE17_9PEZI